MKSFVLQPIRLGTFRLKGMAILMLAVGLSVFAIPAKAQTYNVSLDTSYLTLDPANPAASAGDQYAVDLQLSRNSAGGSVVNVSNFLFGNGSAGNVTLGGDADPSQGSSGDFSRGVVLDNSGGDAEFAQEFSSGGNSGSMVSFTVDASRLAAEAGTPDQFAFEVLDNSQGGQNVPTDDPNGGFTLFTLTRDSTGVYVPKAYSYVGSDGMSHTTHFGVPAATPELGTLTSLGLLMGLFGLGALRARKSQAREAAGTE